MLAIVHLEEGSGRTFLGAKGKEKKSGKKPGDTSGNSKRRPRKGVNQKHQKPAQIGKKRSQSLLKAG